MSEFKIPVEQLDNGMQAVFYSAAYFQTTAVRLAIRSGSLHETSGTTGAAHYLEHLTLKGSDELPGLQDVNGYQEDHDLMTNAFTGLNSITYIADGYEVKPAAFFVAQAALHPLLDRGRFERERGPITQELRGYESDPRYRTGAVHRLAARGEHFSQPIGGYVTDIAQLSYSHLVEYYNRNFDPQNASLVICSSEPVEVQRTIAQQLFGNFAAYPDSAATPIELPNFNPSELDYSAAKVDLPPTAETMISIEYPLPNDLSLLEKFQYSQIAAVLSRMAFRRLREDLSLSYGANAHFGSIDNRNFDADGSWSSFALSTSLDGNNAVSGLNALLKDVMHEQLAERDIHQVLRGVIHGMRHTLQASPSSIASGIVGGLAADVYTVADLQDDTEFVEQTSVSTLQKLHSQLSQQKPLVEVTSPSDDVLEAVADWATTNVA